MSKPTTTTTADVSDSAQLPAPGPWRAAPGKWTGTVTRFCWTAALALAVVGAMVVGYALHVRAFNFGLATVGIYGLVIFAIMLLQFLFSTLNRRFTIPRKRERARQSNFSPAVGLQVVGYREDPVLFEASLRSLAACEYGNLRGLVVCVDGNEGAPDQSMVDVFQRVFPMGKVVRAEVPTSTMTEEQTREFLNERIGADASAAVCVAQAHAGKREAMYTAFRVLLHWKSEWVFTTDSDTVVDRKAVGEMVAAAVDPGTGAVCGDVLIFNVLNWVSFLSSLRYYFAFHVERSAQSLWGSVTCVSGPIGLYRGADLERILHRWVRQTFLGCRATFGDDRHLTNLVISLGQKVYFTPWARCWTDTPVPLVRFLVQQLRWSKSFFREVLFNCQWIHKGSVWLAVELAVQCVYPFFLCTTIVYVLALRSLDLLLLVPIIAILVGLVRALWGVLHTRKVEFLYYTFYALIYMLFLVPTKLFAILTLWSNDWGTSVRSAVVNKLSRALHAFVWAFGVVAAYVGVIVWLAVSEESSSLSWVVAIAGLVQVGSAALLIFLWCTVGALWYLPKKKRAMDALLSSPASPPLSV